MAPAILAELEVWHSRPIAPTRRVAVGDGDLPADPPPGFGGILLGGVMARYVGDLDPDLLPDLMRLLTELEHGRRIPQPRLRYRFQVDRVGLQPSRVRLVGEGEDLRFDFHAAHAAPAQMVLGAAYAAGALDPAVRPAVMATLRRALRWEGRPVGPDLIASLAGFSKGRDFSAEAFEHPVAWAMGVLGFDGVAKVNGDGVGPSAGEVRRRFREQLMAAHPDRGARSDAAAQRIADLTEARRILLGRAR